jgi:hypothetical protein
MTVATTIVLFCSLFYACVSRSVEVDAMMPFSPPMVLDGASKFSRQRKNDKKVH